MDYPKPPRDHMSRQFTYVVHSTENPTPTHALPDSDYPYKNERTENKHPSSFHAGTPEAAGFKVRDSKVVYSHLYKIDRNSIDPLMWRDNMYEGDKFKERVKDIPPMLSESVPYTRDMIADNSELKSPKVIPYRNMVEDMGSTSFIIPKNLIGKGVEYLGTAKGKGKYIR